MDEDLRSGRLRREAAERDAERLRVQLDAERRNKPTERSKGFSHVCSADKSPKKRTHTLTITHVVGYYYGIRFSDHFRIHRAEWADRQGITVELCERIVADAIEQEYQPETERTAHWGHVPERDRYLKVVVEADGEEIVTTHFDRGFRRKMRRRG